MFNCVNHKNILDKQFNYHEHIKRKIKICDKLIGTIKHLSVVHLLRKSLLMTCKSFIQTHLDYGDLIYENPANESSIRKLEKVQYQ